jgi:hypothetical protein
MSDEFLIVPYKVRAAGTDVPPEEVQAGINSLAQQTTIALNTLSTQAQIPSGPAGGDLGGTYPNPTVTGSHITSGTLSGVAITASTVDSTPVGTTTPSTVAGTSVFAGGGTTPAVTATGTQVWNSPSPTVQFIDSIRSAGNKNAFMTWGSTVLAFGFANDAFTSFTNALTITGGQVSGISGITSTSGSGAWAHTGGFSASGGINSTAIGATTPSTGAFTTLTATTPVGVASGGTGRNTLTAHGVLLGEGTAAINQTAVGTTGLALIGQTGADPVFGFPTGALINVQVFTSTGTYTPTAGTNSVIVEVQAPGGGSGGNVATGSGQNSVNGPGGSGAYAKVRLTSGFSGVTATIGPVGAAGAAGSNAGGAGGTTSFGAIISCPGGGGGAAGVIISAAPTAGALAGAGGATPTVSSGTVLMSAKGQYGTPGLDLVLSTFIIWGFGGSSFLGIGSVFAGTTGSGYGWGAVGSFNTQSTAASAGAPGGPGVVIVYEYA